MASDTTKAGPDGSTEQGNRDAGSAFLQARDGSLGQIANSKDGFEKDDVLTPLPSRQQPRPPGPQDFDFDAVTPGPDRYTAQISPTSSRHTGSYFSSSDTRIPLASRGGNSLQSRVNPNMAAAAAGRRGSLSDVRAAHPDLSLSGNIISATFNAPHAFSYHKGGQWVRFGYAPSPEDSMANLTSRSACRS